MRGSGLAGDRGHPGVPGEQGVQDGQDVAPVLAGGVDVAADVEAVLGGVVAGQPAGDLLLGLIRRSPDSLMLFVGHTPVSVVNLRMSASRSRQNSSMSRPGCCFVVFFGPGMRGTSARATVIARRNCSWRGSRMARGSRSGPRRWPGCGRGSVCGALLAPGPASGCRVGFRAVLQVTQDVAGRRPDGRRCSSTWRGSSCRTGR